MIDRLAVRFWLLMLSGHLAWAQAGAAEVAPEVVTPAATPPAANARVSTNLVKIAPGANDGPIAWYTAKLLEQVQYLRRPFDYSVATNFFDHYVQMYDPQHLHFTQEDLAEFDHYRTNLHRLTVRMGPAAADTTPACDIFNRFMERFQQRVAYVDDLLAHEKFTFDQNERIVMDRREVPYPKDLNEAKQLWRERLRSEYLQEKLAKAGAKKKKAAAKEPKSDSGAAEVKKAAEKPKTEEEQIVDTLTHTYHRSLRAFKEWSNDDVLQVYLTALARVYDPHSDYMGSAHLDSFAIGMNLSLSGIGAELRSEDGYCTINRLLPGGPAIKSKKIKEKDRIVAVAQSNQPPVDVVDMNLTKAVQLIRGPKGTEVRLTILAEGAAASESKIVTLIRDEIKLEDQEAKAKVIDVPNGQGASLRLGVIDLPSFYASFDPGNTRGKMEPKSTTADVARLLTKLEKEHVDGVILDLRRNGGGSLEEAVRLTGLFIKKGPVVLVKETGGAVQQLDDEEPSALYEGPLIVLTSRFSASASEIVAGALQDYGRALVVGDASTHGKGTVQSVNPLRPYMQAMARSLTNDPGALKVTIKKFYRASGASTQKQGVIPDIVLPSVANESKDIGEASLENPLPYDTIRSAEFERLNLVQPYVVELRKRVTDRLASDKEYAYIREDIELFKKRQADKTISLNERQRLQEKDEDDARQKARDKERLARKPAPETVYDLSLRQVDLPGLPAPTEKTNSVAKVTDPAAGGTNTALASTRDDVIEAGTDEADEEKPSAVDPPLTEAEHILVDYITMVGRHHVAATAVPAKVGTTAPTQNAAGSTP